MAPPTHLTVVRLPAASSSHTVLPSSSTVAPSLKRTSPEPSGKTLGGRLSLSTTTSHRPYAYMRDISESAKEKRLVSSAVRSGSGAPPIRWSGAFLGAICGNEQ